MTGLRTLLKRGRFHFRRRMMPQVPGRFQPFAHTLPDRYPWLFDFAAAELRHVAAPRLLSFGCSRGDEVFSLRRSMPSAIVRGIDIDPANIETCIARTTEYDPKFVSFTAAPDTHAEPNEQYDAIFCLAVLCHGLLTVYGAERAAPLLHFDTFEGMVEDFARCLKPNGLLFLHTTNFRFGDTATSSSFETILEAMPHQMAPDVLFDRYNRLLPGERYLPVGFRKRRPDDRL